MVGYARAHVFENARIRRSWWLERKGEREAFITVRCCTTPAHPAPSLKRQPSSELSKFGPQDIPVTSYSETPIFVNVYTTGPRDLLNN